MRKVFTLIMIVWTVLWVVFEVRPLIRKGRWGQYCALVGRPLEERRAIVYGRHFYSFLRFAGAHMPAGSTFMLTGLEDGSVGYVRGYYLLYPDLVSEAPEYVLDYLMKDTD